jgi:hypothetical protein
LDLSLRAEAIYILLWFIAAAGDTIVCGPKKLARPVEL